MGYRLVREWRVRTVSFREWGSRAVLPTSREPRLGGWRRESRASEHRATPAREPARGSQPGAGPASADAAALPGAEARRGTVSLLAEARFSRGLPGAPPAESPAPPSSSDVATGAGCARWATPDSLPRAEAGPARAAGPPLRPATPTAASRPPASSTSAGAGRPAVDCGRSGPSRRAASGASRPRPGPAHPRRPRAATAESSRGRASPARDAHRRTATCRPRGGGRAR